MWGTLVELLFELVVFERNTAVVLCNVLKYNRLQNEKT